ncbi:zinc finger protein 525-like isoform X3 [Branchiostoma lanceolatum]|uniref:zinc finger protein 525-like isoform X3 n=1 Tax=Branchiostoma lanceolatum TaxID=7740 RepID=UPI003451D8F9
MSGQQELICGLSHVVTIAVLPRLNMEELIFELNRRIQNLDKENSIKDRLVSILRDVMLEEYSQLKASSPDERTIPIQEQETITMQEGVPTSTDSMPSTHDTPTFSRQLLDTYNSMSTCAEKPLEGEETPMTSCQPTPNHDDLHIKMEWRVFENDHIAQISQPSNPDHPENYADNTEAGFITSEHEQRDRVKSEERPLAPCQPIPDQDCDKMASLLPDHDSEIDSDGKHYLCDVCGFKTSYADSLSKHMQRHKGEKPFMCGECGYRAYTKRRLADHMRKHTGEKPFKCELCDFETAYQANLSYHLKRHTGEKPFKCNQCSYTASHKGRLVEHMKTHTGEKPYSCQICDYQTYRKFDVVKHMMSRHGGVKPYKCEDCDYRTAYKTALTKHRRRHTGERPYSCQECDYKASEKGSLVKHMRNMHQLK